MRIAIAAPSSVPFRLGGAERAWNGLLRELIESTPHQADLIKLPAPEGGLIDVVRSYESFAQLDLGGFDLVITTKYPAWITLHHQHVVYVFHPLRGMYDLYPPDLPRRVEAKEDPSRELLRLLRRRPERAALDDVFGRFRELVDKVGPADRALAFPGPLARETVQFLDRVALDPRYVHRHLALSRTVAGRRGYFPPGASVEVLYLPPFLDGFTTRRFDYLFTPSRLEKNKRVDLLVDAMQHVQPDVRLKIAGSGPELDRLTAMAKADTRVELLGALSDRQLIESYADALAVPVVPHDEELGLVTIEAMRSGKPVITCRDSGGPTELVEHGVTGLVTEPTPQAIGAAIERLAADPELARRLGEAGRRRAESITWRRTVTKLLQPYRDVGSERRPGLSKVVIASTARVHPPREAADLRCAHLARALASEFDVEIVSLGQHGESPSRRILSPGVVETVIPRTDAHARVEAKAGASVGLPVRDLLAAETVQHTPDYILALGRAARSASALVLSRPYLQPVAAALARKLPLAYHAHGAEAAALDAVLPHSDEGTRLRRLADSIEQRAVLDSASILVSAAEDAAVFEAYGGDSEQMVVARLGFDVDAVRPVDVVARAAARNRWLAHFLEPLARPPAVNRLAVFLTGAGAVDFDAARRLVLLAEQLPDVLLVVAGSRPDDLGLVPPNVVLTGRLTATVTRSLLTAADVAVTPVGARYPRLELAECLAAGVPCVSTPGGAYGLPIEDEVHVLVRELPEFPAAVRRLLDEPSLAERLASAGRRLVELHYDAAAAVTHVHSAIGTLVAGGPTHAPVGGR